MAKIGIIDMMLVNDLFQREAGNILDFSNQRLAEFFASELGVDIYAEAYAKNGSSKANAFVAIPFRSLLEASTGEFNFSCVRKTCEERRNPSDTACYYL
jgi:hypothetical protein